jgi:rubrerythrin
MAHRKYLIYAQIAELENKPNLAKLFRAAAESEFFHSESFFAAAGHISNSYSNLKESIELEKNESNILYPELLKRSKELESIKSVNAYKCALSAEKVHFRLFSEAIKYLENNEDIENINYYTCTRCGFTHAGESAPARCPACGTDMFKFREVQ